MRGVAARTAPHTNLDLGGRQDLLEAVPRNRPGGERLPCDDRGLVRHHQTHVRAVEGAPAHHAGALPLAIRALKPAVTERILAPDVERQVPTHLRTVPFQERHEPAEVIEVAVAHDERVDRGGVDLEEIEILELTLGGRAEVKQKIPRLVPPPRLEMIPQPELAHHLASEVGLHDHAHALDLYVAHPRRPLERILRVVDDDAHRQAVDDGRRAPTRRSNPAPEPTGSGGPEQHNSPCARAGANKVSPRPSPIPFHGPASSLTKCAALADGTRLLPKCRLGPAAQEALEAPGRTGAKAATRTMMRNRSRPTRNPNWRTGAGGLEPPTSKVARQTRSASHQARQEVKRCLGRRTDARRAEDRPRNRHQTVIGIRA